MYEYVNIYHIYYELNKDILCNITENSKNPKIIWKKNRPTLSLSKARGWLRKLQHMMIENKKAFANDTFMTSCECTNKDRGQ